MCDRSYNDCMRKTHTQSLIAILSVGSYKQFNLGSNFFSSGYIGRCETGDELMRCKMHLHVHVFTLGGDGVCDGCMRSASSCLLLSSCHCGSPDFPSCPGLNHFDIMIFQIVGRRGKGGRR